MYVSGMNPYFGFFFATTTLIIAVPTAIKVYNWVLTLWRGDIHLTVPMLFALGFIVTFVNGGLTGLFLGNVVVDVPLSDTMFVVAHFHMVMGVAPIMVIFGAIYHWYPKITGRMLNDTLGKFHFWVTFLGAYAIFFPMHYLGLMGVPRRYYELGRDGVHPGVGPYAERLHYRRGIDRGLRAAGVPVQLDLELCSRAGRPAAIRGAPRRWSGRRRRPRRGTATGAGSAGGLSLGLRLQRAGRRAGLHPAERAAGRTARLGSATVAITAAFLAVVAAIVIWWLSHQRLAAKPWLEEGVIGDIPVTGAPRARDGENRAWCFSCRRRLAVCAVFQRLHDAHAHGRRLAPDAACRRCCG